MAKFKGKAQVEKKNAGNDTTTKSIKANIFFEAACCLNQVVQK